MLKLALKDLGFTSVDDIELKRDGISYTIDTIKILKEKFTHLRLIAAQDVACEIHKWKDYQELIEMAPLIIGKREENLANLQNMNENLKNMINKNLITIKNMDISSTDIRERVKNSLYCSHLVPAKVLDYIYQHKLYCLSHSK